MVPFFKVPPVSDYSTCCANRVPTRSVQQLRVYAFDAPTTAYASLHQPLVYKALTNQGGGALVYRPHSLLQYKGQSPSKRAYNTIRVFPAPGSDSLRAIKLVRIGLNKIKFNKYF